MTYIKKYSFFIFLIIALPVLGCESSGSRLQLEQVVIVKIVKKDAWWGCGNSGYTIVQLASKERKKVCAQYGDVGQEISLRPSLFTE